jgi:hypothetical protein
VRLALAEVGAVPATDLAAFVQRRYGVKIDPRFLPVIRASLKDREQAEQARKARAAIAGQPPGGPSPAA